MPADPGSRGVFGDKGVLQFPRNEPREIGGFVTQRLQEFGDAIYMAGGALIGIIAEPERDDPPLAEIAVKFVLAEIQIAKTFEEFGFLDR